MRVESCSVTRSGTPSASAAEAAARPSGRPVCAWMTPIGARSEREVANGTRTAACRAACSTRSNSGPLPQVRTTGSRATGTDGAPHERGLARASAWRTAAAHPASIACSLDREASDPSPCAERGSNWVVSKEATTHSAPAAARAATRSATNVPRPGWSCDGYQRATRRTDGLTASLSRPPHVACSRAARGRMLRYAAPMAVTHETTPFRSSALRPRPDRSRHRGDPRVVVPAPLDPLPRSGRPEEEGCGHPPRQSLVDPRPAPPDARVRRPRLGHLPAPDRGLPPVHLRGDPAMEVVHEQRWRCDRLRDEPGAAHQADPLPQDRPAVRVDSGRARELRVRTDRARRAPRHPVRPQDQPYAAPHSGRRRGSVRVHAGGHVPGRGDQRLLP